MMKGIKLLDLMSKTARDELERKVANKIDEHKLKMMN